MYAAMVVIMLNATGMTVSESVRRRTTVVFRKPGTSAAIFVGNDAQGGSCAIESDGFIGVKSVGTHKASDVYGPCCYDTKARMAGCCDGGDELAHGCSCDGFITRGLDHADISDVSTCEQCGGESADATARITKAA